MMPETFRLPALAIICGLVLSATWVTLQPVINDNRIQFEARQLLDIVDAPNATVTEIEPGVFAVDGTGITIFRVSTNDGYNGRIELWVGVDEAGIIEGVRVKSHQETPGLGDRIELDVSDWILGFEGYSLRVDESSWDVKRFGGDFDQFTGATITPRAVIHAVRDGLVTFESQQSDEQEAGDGR